MFCLSFIKSDIPEFIESLFVSLKHVSHIEVQGVGIVPVLQLLKVGVLSESHVVLRREACCARLCSTILAEWE